MAVEPHDQSGNEKEELACRTPGVHDLAALCRRLNETGSKYVVVGGFAIIQAGYPRMTEDIDLLIELGDANERSILTILGELRDGAARQITPGEVGKYVVVRIADEVMIDLMASACGVTYADAIQDAVWRELDGVRIPFASKSTLWKMKQTHRDKDIPDRIFLAKALAEEGIPLDPPLREKPSDGEIPKWLKRVVQWFESRSQKVRAKP
jgi:hypothetical protein